MLNKMFQAIARFLAVLSTNLWRVRVAIVVAVVAVIVVAAVAPSVTVMADDPIVTDGEASGGSR